MIKAGARISRASMSDPDPITSAHRADLDEVRAWLGKMIKSLRFVELVAAIIALISRMRDVNGELMKQLTNLRRAPPNGYAYEA